MKYPLGELILGTSIAMYKKEMSLSEFLQIISAGKAPSGETPQALNVMRLIDQVISKSDYAA